MSFLRRAITPLVNAAPLASETSPRKPANFAAHFVPLSTSAPPTSAVRLDARFITYSGSSEQLPPAVTNALKSAFIDFPNKKCSLCDDNHLAVPKAHVGFISHRARIGILEKALAGSFGVMPMDLPKKTWSNLHSQLRAPGSATAPTAEDYLTFERMPSLSASTQAERRSRVCYLIEFLADRGAIKNSLSLTGFSGIQRDREFETFEMVGDNAIKYILQDRVQAMFHTTAALGGTMSANLSAIINLLDSNEGLRTIFDYLHLEKIIGVHLPNSKLKSDVVESLFGELQVKIWASEISHDGCEVFSALKAPEHRYLIALMRHLLSELGHVLLQWAVEETMARAKSFVDEHVQSLPITRRLQEASAAQLQHSSMRPLSPPLAMLRKVNSNMRPMASSNETVALVKCAAVRLADHPLPMPMSLLTPLRCVSDPKAYMDSVLEVIYQLRSTAALQHAAEHSQGRRQRFSNLPTVVLRRRDVGLRLLSLRGALTSVDNETLFTALVAPLPSAAPVLASSPSSQALDKCPRAPVSAPAPEGRLLDLLVHRTLASGGFVKDAPVGRSLHRNEMA
jgi:hypothetical protein